MEKSEEKIAIRVARNSIIANMFLSVLKLIAGILSGSTAMISDAVHSITDLFSTIIAIIGVKVASRKADKEHPYGHERFECVAAIILAVLVFVTGIGIGWSGLISIITSDYGQISTFGILALIAALTSIAVKESIYWYVRGVAKKIDSTVLMADAWHSRLDGLSSIGSSIGILGALLGFYILDPLVAIIICLFILKTAIVIFKEAVDKMTDTSCDDATIEEMREVILAENFVLRNRFIENTYFW